MVGFDEVQNISFIVFLGRLTLVDPLLEHSTGRKSRQFRLILFEHCLVVLGDTWNIVNVFHVGIGTMACNLSSGQGI